MILNAIPNISFTIKNEDGSNTRYIYIYIYIHTYICMYIYVCAGDKIEKNEMGWACGAYG